VKRLNRGQLAGANIAGRLSQRPAFRYHLEHVFPESLGGTDDVDNLALACPTCNYYKSNHLLGIDEDGMAGRPLFNPRKDRWHEHFDAL
jgi:hypothetical protein